MKRASIAVALLLFLSLNSQAQENLSTRDSDSKLSIGLHLGIAQSGTDLHSWGNDGVDLFTNSHVVFGLNAEFNLTEKLSMRLNWYSTQIQGNDANIEDHLVRSWNYDSPLNEIGIDGKWTFWSNQRDNIEEDLNTSLNMQLQKKGKISTYLTLGIGLTLIDPSISYSDLYPTNQERKLLDESNFNSTILQFPLGAGIAFALSNKLSLNLEARGVFPTNDLLDGISEQANPERNDSYTFALLRLNYSI